MWQDVPSRSFRLFHFLSLFLLYLPFIPSLLPFPTLIGLCDTRGTFVKTNVPLVFTCVGGWWAKSVNEETTRCVEGVDVEECYISEIDLG